jgi:hypothetical protein
MASKRTPAQIAAADQNMTNVREAMTRLLVLVEGSRMDGLVGHELFEAAALHAVDVVYETVGDQQADAAVFGFLADALIRLTARESA